MTFLHASRIALACCLALPLLTHPVRAGEKAAALEKAPDFTLRTLDGEPFTLSRHLGKGPIILHFWATWCLPCLAEMKALKQVHEDYRGKGLTVLSVTVDDNKTAGKVKGHVRARKYPFTILMDGEKKVFDAFHANDMPHLFLIDREGRIVYSHTGYKTGDEKEIVARLEALAP